MSLDKDITQFFDEGNLTPKSKIKASNAFKELVKLLNKGEIRSAEKRDNAWHANEWVKKGILLGFRIGKIKNFSSNGLKFFDKDTSGFKASKNYR